MHRITLKRLKKQRGDMPRTRAAMALCVVILLLGIPDAFLSGVGLCHLKIGTSLIGLLLSLVLPFWFWGQIFRLSRTANQVQAKPALVKPIAHGLIGYSGLYGVPMSLGAAAFVFLVQNKAALEAGRPTFDLMLKAALAIFSGAIFGAIATLVVTYLVINSVGKALPPRFNIKYTGASWWIALSLSCGALVCPFVIGDATWLSMLFAIVYFIAFSCLNRIVEPFEAGVLEEQISKLAAAAAGPMPLRALTHASEDSDTATDNTSDDGVPVTISLSEAELEPVIVDRQ